MTNPIGSQDPWGLGTAPAGPASMAGAASTAAAGPPGGPPSGAAPSPGPGRAGAPDGLTGEPLAGPPTAPSLSLPTGGGAIRGIGEKFAVSPSTGTASLSLPIPASPGRCGAAPEMALAYDSGSGNGIFGFGWSLSVPAITRKTDKGIPRYDDAAESDVFILSGAEDLVPVLGDDGRPQVTFRKTRGLTFEVRRYRPRVEGSFARIERWTSTADGEIHWRSVTRDNVTSRFGTSGDSRISDPDPGLRAPRVFSWLLAETFDDKGNHVVYRYSGENGAGVDLEAQHEANRPTHARRANRYLKSVRYGNRVSRLADPGDEQSWLLEIVLDYGDHDPDEPAARPDRPWAVRPDPFSTCRAGFEIRTYRRCQRVLVFHHFPDEPGVGADCMVRSLELAYHGTPYSYLGSITSRGWRRRARGGYLTATMPPLELGYSAAVIDDTVRTVDPGSARNLPAGVDGAAQRWIDLDGDGIPGVLSETSAGWWSYKSNLGGGALAPSRPLGTEPAIATQLGRQEFLDLAASGRQDLVQLGAAAPGFQERTLDGGWGAFRTFASLPEIVWDDPDLRFADLTGDGLADVVRTGDDAIVWYASLGRAGFAPGRRAGMPADEAAGPRQVFANGEQTLFLADMTGDGLADLVRVRNGRVSYWPSHGYGRFGRRIDMGRAPLFDTPEAFDPGRIRLADVDGSGTTDLIYLGPRHASVHLNQSGNSWAAPRLIDTLPLVTDLTTATVTDVLGTGTACIVWSSPLPGDGGRALRYLDLNGGRKPHLLTRVAGNLGAETRIGYAPSTRFMLADKAAGTPWVTSLPFCVHVVETVESWDWIGRTRHRTRYRYHHGYYDGVEREFRGFGLVEQFDSDQLAALAPAAAPGAPVPAAANIAAASFLPPTVSKVWYHTGAPPWELRKLPGPTAGNGAGPAAGNGAGPAAGDTPADARDLERMLRENGVIPAGLSPASQREACRSLQGSLLRQEIRGLDGSPCEANPYSVTERRYQVRCCQPAGPGRHGVFFSYPTETLSTVDERDPADPAVTQALTIEVNEFGSVVASAVVGYGRRHRPAELDEHPAIRAAQQATVISFTRVRYTNAVSTADSYRIPLAAESRTWEITGLAAPPGRLLRPGEVAAAARQAPALPYEATPGRGLGARLFDHRRTFFRRDDLSGPLPLGRLESLGLVHASQTLALTAGLVERAYGGRVTATMLAAEGRYRPGEEDGGWWAPSGTVSYAARDVPPPEELAQARRHFFLARRFTDPFGNASTVSYDRYDLAVLVARDAAGNVTSAGLRDARDELTEASFDYRVLHPTMIMDANWNQSMACFDALGMVAASAVSGKPGQQAGDSLRGVQADLSAGQVAAYLADPAGRGAALLGDASARFVYDRAGYYRTRAEPAPAPAATGAIIRERHVAGLGPGERSRLQHVIAYSDGFGRDIQTKALAEPGPVTEGGPDVAGRWVTTGWTIFNNKGLPVRRYEPFLTGRPGFEFAVTAGVSPVVIYDPVGRMIAVLYPDHSWEKVVFGAWRQQSWDRNDTVADRPDHDPDIGGYLAAIPAGDYLPTWREQRTGGALGPGPREAAAKAAVCARTPAVSHFDTLGRTIAAIVHNRVLEDGQPVDSYHVTTAGYDIQGNIRIVTDPLGRPVLRQDYGLTGVPIRSRGIDEGERRALYDAAAQPLRSWNSRDFAVRQDYDELRRPTATYVSHRGGRARLAELISYGESAPHAAERNLRGVPHEQRDAAGISVTERRDFQGNALEGTRRLACEYRDDIDWSGEPALEAATYRVLAEFDALSRPVAVTAPDGSITRRTWNQRGLLQTIDVRPGRDEAATVVLEELSYDARGQVTLARYGNGAVRTHAYDPETFRLIRTRTTRRRAGGTRAGHTRPPRRPATAGAGERLQDLCYDYDPFGNLTRIQDRAEQDIFFAGQAVSPTADYTYDATYRLIAASGREHRGQDRPREGGPWRGGPGEAGLPGEILPGDGPAMRGYRETYRYNGAGNLERLVHHASQGSWNRTYHYDETGSSGGSNRLTSTTTGADEARYRYDANGNMVAMPHLAVMAWDWADQLHATARRAGGRAGPVTYYQYDGDGARMRKVTDGERGTRRSERIYLGGYEIYREYSVTGEVTMERQDLHVASGSQVICRIETTTAQRRRVPGPAAARRYRYQLDNHLGSSCVELDEHGAVLTYEEYYPWGGSSWRAGRSRAETGLKRYRFSGKESDDETGLYYFGSRYYAPWLGRWTAPDPSGLTDGTDGYAYARDNPVCLVDPAGADAASPDQTAPPTDDDLDAGAPAPKQTDGGSDGDAGAATKPMPTPDYVNETGEAVFLMPADEAQKQHAELQEGGAAPQDEAEKGNVPTVDNKAVREYVHQEVVIGAKAAARNDPIIATAVILTGIVTYQFDKKKGQAIISSIDGPEPESEIAQAAQTYTAAGIAVVETLADAAAGGLSELAAAPRAVPLKGNPFEFMEGLNGMGETLQEQVSTVQETLRPFEGIRHGDISVPPNNRTMIAGATTVVGGQQRTVVTFSNESAHNVFARGHAELPSGVELGPVPKFDAQGKLLKQSHVERGAVNSLRGRYGAQGGLVTTSGNACGNCARVWSNGKAFPTWIHRKQY